MREMTREKALTERELEWLLLGAGRIGDNEQQMESWAAILIGARLGLRAGELIHLDESWVSLRRQMIHIPAHDPCAKGRDDGPCGSCKQAAKQSATHNPESVEEILEDYWRPKTDAAVRDIPFGFAPRVAVAVEWLVDEYGGWPHSFSTLQRRLNQSLERAPELDGDSTTLHGLRGTAASFHAGRGLDPGPLQSMFGWSDLATARNYIAVDGEMTRRALSEVHG